MKNRLVMVIAAIAWPTMAFACGREAKVIGKSCVVQMRSEVLDQKKADCGLTDDEVAWLSEALKYPFTAKEQTDEEFETFRSEIEKIVADEMRDKGESREQAECGKTVINKRWKRWTVYSPGDDCEQWDEGACKWLCKCG